MAVLVVPTKKCDLRCRHCMRSTFASGYLDTNLFTKFVDDVRALGNNLKWTMTGGEPTVHPDIGEFLRIFKSRGIGAHMVTNGQRAEGYEECIKPENKAGLHSVCVSFDSPFEEMNNLTRGPDAYRKSIEAVKAYSSSKINTTVGFVLHDENVHTIEDCIKFGKQIGAHQVSVWTFQQWVSNVSNEGSKYKSLRTDKDLGWSEKTSAVYRKHATMDLVNKYKPLKVTLGGRFDHENTNPTWPTKMLCQNKPTASVPLEERLILLPDGKVSLCCDLYDVDYNYNKYESVFDEEPLSDIMGDYSKQPLSEILEHKQKHFQILEKRRKRDATLGLLTNGRENVCTNCAYYHYQPAKSKVKTKSISIPVVTA